MIYDILVFGGGAAGIFAAIAAKNANPSANVALFEKSAVLLSKVRISGGGRCNVTHSCFDPKELIQNYPRGGRELLGPFHRFQPHQTIEWFESRGVKLKTESDGRMFPITDSSETIIACLLSEAKKIGVEIVLRKRTEKIEKKDDLFAITLKEGDTLYAKKLLLATGSSEEGYLIAQSLGHSIQKPVPSLFTFNVPSSHLKELSGISVDPVQIKVEGTSLSQIGPLLITHFGFSGPAALKLSAWGARYFYEKSYHVTIQISWLPHLSKQQILEQLLKGKTSFPTKILFSENPFRFPKSLWKAFLDIYGETFKKPMGNVSLKDLQTLCDMLHADSYQVEGKTTNKEEFVTCGGVSLKEVDFKTMESKLCKGLFFAGEILDIDGVTGGFNFQNAWTTGYIAGTSASSL
jgi:predicted Rossmann fold flavoprotein